MNQQASLLGKVAAYTEILIKDPNSTIFVSLAEIYRKMGLFDDAVQILTKGFEKHPDLAPAHIVMGRIQCQQGDYQLSSQSFSTALKFDPESLAALVGFARVKVLLEDYETAREILTQARSLSPADPVINKLILSLPEPEPPEEVTPAELDKKPDSSTTSTLLSVTIADLHYNQGNKQEALAMYRQLSEKEPDNLELRRKIRQTEQALNSHDMTEVEPAQGNPEADSLNTVSDNNSIESALMAGGQEQPEISDNSATDADTQFMVDELNRWLVNIAKRRENV